MSQSFSPPKSYMKILYFSENTKDPAKIVHLPNQLPNASFASNQLNCYSTNNQPIQMCNNLCNFQPNSNYFLNTSNIPPCHQFNNIERFNNLNRPYMVKNFNTNNISICSSNPIYKNQQYLHQISKYSNNKIPPITNNNNTFIQNVSNLQNAHMLSSDLRISTIDMRGTVKKSDVHYPSNNSSPYIPSIPPNSLQSFGNPKIHKFTEHRPNNTNYSNAKNNNLFNKNLDCLKTFPNKLEKFRNKTKFKSLSSKVNNNNKLNIKRLKVPVSYKKSYLESDLDDKVIRLNKVSHSVTFNSLKNIADVKLENDAVINDNSNINTFLPTSDYKSRNQSLITTHKRKYTKRKSNSTIIDLINENNEKTTKLDFDTKNNTITSDSVKKHSNLSNFRINKMNKNIKNSFPKVDDNCISNNPDLYSGPYTQLLEKSDKISNKKSEMTDKFKNNLLTFYKVNDKSIKNLKRNNGIIEKQQKKSLLDFQDNVKQRWFSETPNITKNKDPNFNISYEEANVKSLQLDCINKLQSLKKSGIRIDNISKHLAAKTSAIKKWSENKIGDTFLQMESCLKLPPYITRCCECMKNLNVEASGCRFYSFRKLYYTLEKLKVVGYPLPMEAEADDLLLWMADPELIFNGSSNHYLTDDPKSYNSLTEIGMNESFNEDDALSSVDSTDPSRMVDFFIGEEREIQNQRDEVDLCSIGNNTDIDRTYIDQPEQFCDTNESDEKEADNMDAPGYAVEEIVSTNDRQKDLLIKSNIRNVSESYGSSSDSKPNLTCSGVARNCDVSIRDATAKDGEDGNGWKDAADIARYILSNIGGRFCQLVEQEKMLSLKKNGIVWRRSLDGVREMCDECRTTIFNMHWTCQYCGFSICIDCYLGIIKSSKILKLPECHSTKQIHNVHDLTPTQILPSDVLLALDDAVHEIESQLTVHFECNCSRHEEPNINSQLNNTDNLSPNKSLQEISTNQLLRNNTGFETVNHHGYKKLCNGDQVVEAFTLMKQYEDLKDKDASKCNVVTSVKQQCKERTDVTSTDALKCNVLSPYSFVDSTSEVMKDKLNGPLSKGALRRAFTKFNRAPYTWLDNGRLLQLTSPYRPKNIEPFQHMWKMGQPVIVSNCQDRLDLKLWHPQSFTNEFGHISNDLVDCASGATIDGWTMSTFWNGFEKVKRRKKNLNGEPMILKLKDWPSTADFSEVLPSRFNNLMHALPLPEYSGRDGVFNLASRLPDHYVRPDLGPKMYSAYGTAINPKVGSTNLHLDISDAVNLMIYVGVPKDDVHDHEAAAFESMNLAGCCEATLNRIKKGDIPGALWHIYDARDSPAIRVMLRKYAEEQGEIVEENSDPIHDQCVYLNSELRRRLEFEYGVIGISIVQCVGDAVFIPAGAPHQVQNFHSCVKAAEDFVSPENLAYCFHLTQEFRNLSDTHSNHEDKLQVKNILYHSVKQSVAVLKKKKVPTATLR